MTDYKDITLKTENGRTIYFPRDYQFVRYAGTACCAVVKRMVEFRQKLIKLQEQGKIPPELYENLKECLQPIPMEEKFLSSNIIEVHDAIEQLIKENLPEKHE